MKRDKKVHCPAPGKGINWNTFLCFPGGPSITERRINNMRLLAANIAWLLAFRFIGFRPGFAYRWYLFRTLLKTSNLP